MSNPVPAGEEFPEVVELAVRNSDDSRGVCSGVFIKPRILLTAAHCTYEKNGKGRLMISYKGPDGVVHPGKMFPSRKYRSTDDVTTHSPNDLAMISFDTDVAPAIARTATTKPIKDEVVIIVGFGISSMDKDQRKIIPKSFGVNRIQGIKGNTLVIRGLLDGQNNYPPGQLSVGLPGDSGGGMFNQRGELVGINVLAKSDNEVNDLGNVIAESTAVNLTHRTTKNLLDAIETDFCTGKNLEPGASGYCKTGGFCGLW